MVECKETIYIASGDSLEAAFLAMAKFINQKYIQGDQVDSTPFRRNIKKIS